MRRRLEAARSPSTKKVPRSDSAPILTRHDTPVEPVDGPASTATPPSDPHVQQIEDEDGGSNDSSSDPDTREFMTNIFLGPSRPRTANASGSALQVPRQPIVTQQDLEDMKRIQDWHRARAGRTMRLEGDVAEQVANQHLRPEGRRSKGWSPQKRPHPVTPEHDVFFSSERARQMTTIAASPSRANTAAQLLPLPEDPSRTIPILNPAPARPPVKKARPTEGEKLMKAIREVGKQEARELQRDIENMRAKRGL